MRSIGSTVPAAAGAAPLAALLALLLLGACAVTEVKLTEQGKTVRAAASLADATGCAALGRIAAYSTNTRQDIEQQRTLNAQNRAAELGANLIVSGQATLMTVGGREFEAYRCPP